MSDVMAYYSWGRPTRINRWFGTNEQWVYGSGNNKLYLNFDNGLLTSWHD